MRKRRSLQLNKAAPRRLTAALAFFACAASLAACDDSDEAPMGDAAIADAAIAEGGVADAAALFLNRLERPEDFAALAADDEGGDSAGVKYLAPVAGRPPFAPLTAPCTFQNMRRHSWHLTFLRSFPEHAGLSYDAYLALVLQRPSRRLWGGTLVTWPLVPHPASGAPGVVSYSVYGERGQLDVDEIIEVDRTLKSCAPFARDLLVFVPELEDQHALLTRERARLTAAGVASLFPEELVVGVPHLSHSAGEGYGTLRIVPVGRPLDDYGPRDVVIVESAPNDISIVAGLLTKNPQNELGHVNLRLREKKIPNVTVPRIYEAAWIRALDGHLVRLKVTRDDFRLEPATLADAEAFWAANRPRVRPPTVDLAVTALASFRELRASGAAAYGAKAANLGELTRVLDPPHRNEGFGVPFARHAAFLRENGVDGEVEALATDPRLRTDAAYKRARLKAVRDRIRGGVVPPDLQAALAAAIDAAFGAAGSAQRLRLRSSTNVEDLDAFTGAGLYESKTGCLADDLDGDEAGPSRCLRSDERAALEAELAARRAELSAHPDRVWLHAIVDDLEEDTTEEKTIAAALKKVYASLWTERAFDEREHYGIDHRLAQMGVAVNPSFVLERASAVALSNLAIDGGAPLYRLNSQVGSESVVRPEDPTAIAELLTFRRAGAPPEATQIEIVVRSTRVAPGGQVWPPETLAELARLLFRVHDHFATVVYPQITPLHLDFEIKHGAEGDVVIKQVRPFAGGL